MMCARQTKGTTARLVLIANVIVIVIVYLSLGSPKVAASQEQQQQQQPKFKLVVPANILQAPAQGPGVDLVALNLRRFELDHHHKHRYRPNNPHVVFRDDSLDTEVDDESSLARSRLIEAQVAALPGRLLNQLPEELTRQLVESVSADVSLLGLTGRQAIGAGDKEQQADEQPQLQLQESDPDGASIERLTKSCLSVQASSLPADQLNVTFHLYTRSNPRHAFVMGPQVTRDEIILRSPFRASQPVKWITHGFHTNLDKSHWMLEARDKILAHEDANVILTDWRRGASPALAFYPKAAANAHVVAKMIVKILRRLWRDIQLARVHLIGHSLGAHIMGFVGSAFTEEYLHKQQQAMALTARSDDVRVEPSQAEANNQLIGRITACDPALPCFGSSSSGPASRSTAQETRSRGGAWARPARHKRQLSAAPSGGGGGGTNNNLNNLHLIPSPADDWTPAMWTHLRPDSAILVEVMHSNPGVMGYAEPLGDYDFFPNGSERQPGCENGEAQHDHGRRRRRRRRKRRQVNETTSGEQEPRPQIRQIQRRQQTGGVSGFMKTLGQFIKPIKDFFQAYTCSHHRSVEYMVESLYYELVPRERRLEPALVCQMVGYRCPDYRSFKRGFCFTCRDELECRTFGLPAGSRFEAAPTTSGPDSGNRWWSLSKTGGGRLARAPTDLVGYTQTLASQFAAVVGSTARSMAPATGGGRNVTKRVLPSTSQQYRHHYKPTLRSQYYFDTRPAHAPSQFCLNHYHLLVRYRWFRIRDSLQLARFRLLGSLNDLSSTGGLAFNKFTQHTYTMLVTSADFLGAIQSLLVYGDHLRPQLIDFIQVTYMSNLDPQVRATCSARLCRAQASQTSGASSSSHFKMARWLAASTDGEEETATPISMFVPCPSGQALVR